MISPLAVRTFRVNKMPHIWCPGCGHGIVMAAIARSIEKVGLDKDKTCIVSGIGCSSRAPGYMNFNTLHTTHGRAIAFATGVKMANPELNVIVVTGDGDFSAIGGNHMIHAARRNIDLTVICFNNSIYGMTGGQYSPTTPSNDTATTAPYGNIDKPFDLMKLLIGAGTTYAARSTAYHVMQLEKYIFNGINHKGLAVIEAITHCPTYYGRKNRKGDSVEMLKWQKDSFIDKKAAERLPEDKKAGKFLMGEFVNEQAPEYTEQYQTIIDRLRGEK